MFKLFILIDFITILVRSESEGIPKETERQQKFLTLNTLDDEINVDLQFSIPFIKIPVKKTMNSIYGLTEFPTININPAALALGGAVVMGSTIVIPFLIKHYANYQEDYRYARLLNTPEFGSEDMLEFAQQMLMNTQGFRGCPLRLACWAAQKEIMDPRLILNQIVNNKLLSSMVNSSAVEDAMISGLHGRGCDSYGPCPLQEHHLPILLNNLAVLTNSPGDY